jgi:CCR4-NOT transcription complex subunit 3
MAKNRKLQKEIELSLKQTDEGITLLSTIYDKLIAATSLQMKEKHEQDMKKEIKKLQ